jgi:hypothetical protein
MLCPHCHAENTDNCAVCISCQKALIGAAGAAATNSPAVASSSSPKKMSVMGAVAIAITILLALLFAFSRPVEPRSESYTVGYRIGTFIGALFFPTLIAYVVAGRRKARNPNRFAFLFLLVGIPILALNWLGTLAARASETPEQHVGRLMREAAELQPVRNQGSSRERDFDDAMRKQFRRLIDRNREYSVAVEKLNLSDVDKINSPESFADPGLARNGLNQLRVSYDLDAEQEEKVKEILEDLRRAVASSASSAWARERMLKGFDESIASKMPQRRQLIAAEKAWVDAVDDEYDYANQHRKEIRLVNGHLVIQDATLRDEFNAKVQSQESRRKEFLQAKEDFTKGQARDLQKFGLDPKKLGTQ